MAVDHRGTTGGLPPVRRRPSLPNGRAVVGGLLVAASAVGIYGVQHTSTAPPGTRYVVAARPLVAGQALESGDLSLAAADLPIGATRRSFTTLAPLIGRVLVANLADGELVQASSVGPARALGTGEREVSFSVDPSRALGDRIVPGDIVDVLATYTAGGISRTEPVVLFARIIDRQDRAGIGGASGFVFTVAISRPEDVLRLVSSIASGTLTIVRSTTAAITHNTTPYPAAITNRGQVADGEPER